MRGLAALALGAVITLVLGQRTSSDRVSFHTACCNAQFSQERLERPGAETVDKGQKEKVEKVEEETEDRNEGGVWMEAATVSGSPTADASRQSSLSTIDSAEQTAGNITRGLQLIVPVILYRKGSTIAIWSQNTKFFDDVSPKPRKVLRGTLIRLKSL